MPFVHTEKEYLNQTEESGKASQNKGCMYLVLKDG